MPNETYKQFLIYPNLRTYKDHNGKLTPMFVFTEFNTLDEVKARIDAYWLEWEQWENRRKVNYQQSLAKLVSSDEDGREQDQEDFAAKVDAYYERELLNDK